MSSRIIACPGYSAGHGKAAAHRRWCERDLPGADFVYCWADGLHLGVRLGQDRVCTLVVIGVRADGRKELAALADGHRESTESRASLLRDARRRGMRVSVLAAGDRALGFWPRCGCPARK